MERYTFELWDGCPETDYSHYIELEGEQTSILNKRAAHQVIVGEAIERLAEYENAEANGLILNLPCKVGDKIYLKTIDKDMKITGYSLGRCTDLNNLYYHCECVNHEKNAEYNSPIAIGVCPSCAFREKCFQGFQLSDWGKTVFPNRETAKSIGGTK